MEIGNWNSRVDVWRERFVGYGAGQANYFGLTGMKTGTGGVTL